MLTRYFKSLLLKLLHSNPYLLFGTLLCLTASIVCVLYSFNFCNKVIQGNSDSTYVVSAEGDYLGIAEKLQGLDRGNCYKVTIYCENDIRIVDKGGYSLSDGRGIENANEIVLGSAHKDNLGDTIAMVDGGREYLVVGIASDYYGFTLSAQNRTEAFEVLGVEVIANRNYDDVEKSLESIFGSESITYPEKVSFADALTAPVVIYMAVLCFFALLCIAMSLKYIFGKNIELMTVYSNLGVNGNTISALSYLSTILLLVLVYIPSVIVYVIAEQIWFKDGVIFGFELSTVVSPLQYLVVLLLLVLLFSIVLLPYIIKTGKKIARGEVA